MNDILRNNVAARLAAGEVALSMQVRLVESIEIAQIAHACGYDTLYVDVEHSTLTLRQTGQICMAALAVGITPFVRVPSYEPEFVSRYLDAGAMGIIAPHVSTRADAQKVVVGARSFRRSGRVRCRSGFRSSGSRAIPRRESRRALNAHTTVVAMIEGPEALDNVEEIAAVEGVDILFIGTNDLCAQMGIDGQFDHPAGAAGVREDDRRMPPARQARRRRRPRGQAGAARRIRAHGRAATCRREAICNT